MMVTWVICLQMRGRKMGKMEPGSQKKPQMTTILILMSLTRFGRKSISDMAGDALNHSSYLITIFLLFAKRTIANSVDPDEMPHLVASHKV